MRIPKGQSEEEQKTQWRKNRRYQRGNQKKNRKHNGEKIEDTKGAIRRRTENTMEETKEQKGIQRSTKHTYKTFEYHELHLKPEMNSGAPEG